MEMESSLIQHPAVVEAAVVGQPDEVKGQVPVAFVTLEKGFTPSPELEEALKSQVVADIGKFARPEKVYFVEAMPKTRSGKIIRRMLREIIQVGEVRGDVTGLEDYDIVEKLVTDIREHTLRNEALGAAEVNTRPWPCSRSPVVQYYATHHLHGRVTGLTASDDERFMRRALEQARKAAAYGEVPIGAVIVRDGLVIAEAHNWRETWRDATAHAELIAIQEASRRVGGWRLEECDLYVTLEPCPMCAGALIQARIRRLVYGAADPKGGAVTSKVELLQPGRWNHYPEITSGILAKECGMILTEFFRDIRSTRANRASRVGWPGGSAGDATRRDV